MTFETIYDAGGTDTFDLSLNTRSSIIDLRDGFPSSINYYSALAQDIDIKDLFPYAGVYIDQFFSDPINHFQWGDNIYIALGVIIENVKCGSDSDKIIGNDSKNNISGGNGADTIEGGPGDDFLRGDDGEDSISGGDGFDDINGNRGDDVCYGGLGNDWVIGGQGNDLLLGEDGKDIVYGNQGNDSCYGGNDDDWVRGGGGDDLLYGESGNDFMSGDRGNDTVYGGAGADTFNLIAGAGIDRIADFNSAEGDRISIEGNRSYVLSFLSGAAIITTTDGSQMILDHVASVIQMGTWLLEG